MKFRKTLALLMCTVMSASVFASCGKEINVEDSSSSSSSDKQENVDIANFTAPEKGETVIIMNIKDYGEVKIKLFPEYADKGVENFVELAKKGYYDGLTFHRVIKDFMIQGGDPEGTGMGGAKEKIKGEFLMNGVPNDLRHERGVISMARAQNPNSASSQFFICHKDSFFLDGQYAAFGRVVDGMDAVDEIAEVQTDYSDRPLTECKMKRVFVQD